MNGTKSKIWIILLGLGLPTVAGAITPGQPLNVTAARGLNLRYDAGRGAGVLDVLNQGEKVTATGRERRGWLEVKIGDLRGWVKSTFVTEAGYCATCGTAPEEGPILRAGRAIVRTIKNTVLSYARKLSDFFKVGYRVGAYKCWRAVWNVLKRAKLVSGDLTQRYAKDAFKDLRKFGFHHDATKCKTPGVIRVYDNARAGYGTGTAGDYAGHIETMGPDGCFHHFLKSCAPLNELVGNNSRPLKYCLVK